MNNSIGVKNETQFGLFREFLNFNINVENFAVRAEQINSRIRLYPRIIFTQIALAFLLTGIMWNGVAHEVLLTWLILVCTAHAFEIIFWARFRDKAKDIAQCQRWNLAFCWFSGLVGIIWGSTGLLMFVPEQMLYQTYLICVLLGISAGAMSSNPVHPPSLFIHMSALVLPLVMRIFWEGDSHHLILGSMLLIYIVFVFNAARELIHIFEQSLLQRIDNEKLAAELEQAQSIAHIGSWHYVLATYQLTWTAELYKILGVSPETFIPSVETFLNLIHPDDQATMQVWIELCSKGKKPKALEFRCVWPDGTIRLIEGQGELILDEEDKPSYILGTGQDITERKRVEEQINDIAYHDSLTGLPNRRCLDDKLEQTIANCKRSGRYGAVIFLDLDNFKPLNDTYGHKAGDLLLVEIAHRLVSCVREVDTVARFGGDEFVVVLSELDGDESQCAALASIVSKKIHAALAEPFKLDSNLNRSTKMVILHNIGTSIGVVLFNKNANAEHILNCADMAMYQAKEAGRNQIRFYDAKS